jgi:iron(III) transport system substrate-binding protein
MRLNICGRTAVITVIAALMFVVETPSASRGEDLVDLGRKDGKVVWYTSVESSVADVVAKAFQDKYRISVDVVRTGSERVLTRFLQEAQAGVRAADVVQTSDVGDFVLFKQKDLLAKFRPEGAEAFPASFLVDREETYFGWRASLCVIMYNTRLVTAAEAPTGWMDLLNPKWKGKIVVGHPNYSGIILTCVNTLTKLFGWEYYQKLKQNDVMIRQSANDPPTVVASGERVVGGNGAEYYAYVLRARGNPVAIVYPKEGVPLAISPSAIAKSAPHPNAAKVFTNFIFSKGVQQLLATEGGLYVPHPGVTYPRDKPPLAKLKLLIATPDELVKRNQEIKERFTSIFGV